MSDLDEKTLQSAHKHASHNRREIMSSETCGCFYCGEIYAPGEISEWVDLVDGDGQTAICPHCSVDAVLGSASGFPITAEFFDQMYARWFT